MVLDTSMELASASGNDQHYAATIQDQILNQADKLTTHKKLMLMYGDLVYKRVLIEVF